MQVKQTRLVNADPPVSVLWRRAMVTARLCHGFAGCHRVAIAEGARAYATLSSIVTVARKLAKFAIGGSMPRALAQEACEPRQLIDNMRS